MDLLKIKLCRGRHKFYNYLLVGGTISGLFGTNKHRYVYIDCELISLSNFLLLSLYKKHTLEGSLSFIIEGGDKNEKV